ncbi:MAG: hypothetical protein ACLS28_23245 [Clostridium neonatale]
MNLLNYSSLLRMTTRLIDVLTRFFGKKYKAKQSNDVIEHLGIKMQKMHNI